MSCNCRWLRSLRALLRSGNLCQCYGFSTYHREVLDLAYENLLQRTELQSKTGRTFRKRTESSQNIAEIQMSYKRMFQYKVWPNKLAQSVTLLAFIFEVSGSNLGQKTDFSNSGSCPFSSAPDGKCQDSTTNWTTAVSFHIPFKSVFISTFHSQSETMLSLTKRIKQSI